MSDINTAAASSTAAPVATAKVGTRAGADRRLLQIDTRIGKLNTEIAGLQTEAAAIREGYANLPSGGALVAVNVGDSVLVSIGKGESKGNVVATVIGIRAEDKAAKQPAMIRVMYGEGFDSTTVNVFPGQVVENRTTAAATAPAEQAATGPIEFDTVQVQDFRAAAGEPTQPELAAAPADVDPLAGIVG